MILICIHCHRSKKKLRTNGLCRACNRDRSIRIRYPIVDNEDYLEPDDFLTEEQLDAMIEEQRRIAPEWFYNENPGDD